MDFTTAVDLMGLIAVGVFAVTGGLEAARHRMDILGFVLIGTVTGIGGGTLRDLLLGLTPVFWVRDPTYITICIAAAVATYFIATHLGSIKRSLIWLDAIGLSLFSVVGAKIALDQGSGELIALCMGIMSATFGGIARDVLVGSTLTLMNEELYITTTVVGVLTYLAMGHLGFPEPGPLIGGFIAGFLLRAAAINYQIKLPNRYRLIK